MVRGKTQIKRIENTSSRQVSFSKRRSGLLKKAFELSVLCEAEVALMVFSPTGKLYEFSSSSSINQIIERYKKNANNPRAGKTPTAAEENTQHLQEEAEIMTKKMEHLEECKRRLLGVGLEAYTADELQETETHLEQSLRKIRARKSQLLGQKIQELKEEERRLTNENAKLHMESELQTMSLYIGCQGAPAARELADVETELFIGPPARRWTRH